VQRYYTQPMSEKRGSYDRAVAEEVTSVPKEVPKPYTTPKGYVPPSIGEQFRYAYARHPYANSGFGAAFAIGLAAWLYVSYSKPAVTAVAHNGKVRGADA